MGFIAEESERKPAELPVRSFPSPLRVYRTGWLENAHPHPCSSNWRQAKKCPSIRQWGVESLKQELYGRAVKTKKTVAIKSSSPASLAKPGRAEIRREEPRRSAPRAVGNKPERGNQPRTSKSGKK